MGDQSNKRKSHGGSVHRATLSDPNPNETFARYQSAPFRQFSNRNFHKAAFHDVTPMLNNGKGAALQNDLADHHAVQEVLERQKKLENSLQHIVDQQTSQGPRGGAGAGHPQGYDAVDFDPSAGQSNAGGQSKRPEYSLAGPRGPPPSDQYKAYRDPDYRNFGEETDARPQPKWGLAKPFPHVSRRGKRGRSMKRSGAAKGSTRGHPQGQVGGGPGGHHGSPVRGQPQGEVPGGPATKAREQADEDEGGHANFVEHFADTLTGPGELTSAANDSQETLTDEADTDEEEHEEIPNYWFHIRRMIREPLAEWLATMVAILMGVAGNLQVKTSKSQDGGFTQSAAMWGIGTMMAIYIAGGISGAHCNPMVSISLTVFRGFPFRKCIIYIAAQCVGAITAVFIVYGIYKDAILALDPHKTTGNATSNTGTAFFTLPASFATPVTAFFTDFTSAAVMLGTILALGDDTNAPPGAGMHAFIIALIGFAMASTLGYNTGPQTNPAKDLATRFVPWVVGYGSEMWERAWWVEAWTAAVCGGLFGSLIYDLAIFEGPESPVNYPRVKRRRAAKGTKGKWLKTGLFGKAKKQTAKKDLEEGTIGILDPTREKRLDGH
ncbi:MAG: hypothetical protein M1821_003839 [Bathelium mastoideum]|nr:MAG: hypothetical protein M1821_003839 [Bathelium mastoideum]